MLPITEFQFAFCGIATVAATLGYAYSRKANTHSPTSTDKSGADVEAGPLEERSLKRKLDDSDNDETCVDEQQRPMKRSKTPPTEQRGEEEEEWEVIVAPPTYEEATAPQKKETLEHSLPPSHDANSTFDIKAPREKSPDHAASDEAHVEKQGIDSQKPTEPVRHTPDPSPPLNDVKAEPEAAATQPPKPAKTLSSNPFSAFANSGSPFATYSNPNGPAGHANQGERTTPAWRQKKDDSEIRSDNSTQKLTSSPNGHTTGEEDEVVISDLKGAKLFIKRGRKEFTSGMYGHVKLLSYKSDASEGKEDKVFRRDPLGQVSMNVALRPTVRCHFDEPESILRVILKEPQVTVGEEVKEDIVIYAFKVRNVSGFKVLSDGYMTLFPAWQGIQSGLPHICEGSVRL
ncbi:hypothetical protein EDD15DRAFT_2255433 [Pisolithus albus]|nr:hypothetical protein EDD15DRAFT_2255433 [Pisolithus albus]